MRVEQARGGTVQVVVTTLEVAKTVGLIQWPLPRMPKTAILAFDLQVHGDLADVMQQGAIGDAGGPGISLGGLVFRRGAGGKQIGLAQFQTTGDQFQSVVEHAAEIRMVVRFAGRELLDLFGVAMDRI
ncbi:hypothetical protein D3C87_1245000 [compost metagenome]